MEILKKDVVGLYSQEILKNLCNEIWRMDKECCFALFWRKLWTNLLKNLWRGQKRVLFSFIPKKSLWRCQKRMLFSFIPIFQRSPKKSLETLWRCQKRILFCFIPKKSQKIFGNIMEMPKKNVVLLYSREIPKNLWKHYGDAKKSVV